MPDAALPPVTETRTFHGVEVGLIHEAPVAGQAARTWVVFPDGKLRLVNPRAYENLDEAAAAIVAVWRIRRIRRGLDKPVTPGPTPLELFEAIQAEANSETVTEECGEVGKYGAHCHRQKGHEFGEGKHAAAHVGRVREGGPDATYIDDGKEEFEIWATRPKVVH